MERCSFGLPITVQAGGINGQVLELGGIKGQNRLFLKNRKSVFKMGFKIFVIITLT